MPPELIAYWEVLVALFIVNILVFLMIVILELDIYDWGRYALGCNGVAFLLIIFLAVIPLPFMAAAWIFKRVASWIWNNIPLVILVGGLVSYFLLRRKDRNDQTSERKFESEEISGGAEEELEFPKG